MDFPVIVHLPWAMSNTRYFELLYLFSPRIRNSGVELNVDLAQLSLEWRQTSAVNGRALNPAFSSFALAN